MGLARRVELIEDMIGTLTDAPGELFALKCDMSKEEEILEAFNWVKENVGPVSVLVNNAGFIRPTTLLGKRRIVFGYVTTLRLRRWFHGGMALHVRRQRHSHVHLYPRSCQNHARERHSGSYYPHGVYSRQIPHHDAYSKP